MSYKTIGIIGGGQLGLMIAEAAHQLGARVVCLDPSSKAPASSIADTFITGSFDDLAKLEELCKLSDVITYEFENIKADILKKLVAKYNIKQGIEQLFVSQDRLREKSLATSLDIKTPKYYNVESLEDLYEGIKEIGYPLVFKTRTLGYDGHGQVVLKAESDIEKVKPLIPSKGILEEFISYDLEASIIMVRSEKELIHFPVVKNIHKDGILDLSIVPAGLNEEVMDKLKKNSKKLMETANYYGILAIEYFIKDNEVYYNEMAPRPHNSGHYTIEGCNTSQYLELCRYLLDMPLVIPKLINPTVMKNILGFDYQNAIKLMGMKLDNCFIHLYGKEECKEKRKMGHITFTNTTLAEYNNSLKKYFM